MAKTVTIRIEDEIYDLFRKAADGEHRSISNFIEYATLSFLSSETYVTDNEMEDILKDKKLIKNLKNGLSDVENGKYRIVT
jgi:hypothetical protein